MPTVLERASLDCKAEVLSENSTLHQHQLHSITIADSKLQS